MRLKNAALAVAMSAILFTACKEAAKEPVKTSDETTVAVAAKSAPIGKIETASFHIEGMTCAVMCAAKIEKELSAMDGVQKATVDFDKKTATVEYDNAKQTPQKLVQKVEAVADGKTYKVSALKSTADHAMLNGDQEKAKKADKKTKTDKKSCTKETKGACCSGKKHCSDEKKGTM